MPEGTHKRVNVYLDRRIHGYFIDEIGDQNVSVFFRLVEEELLAQPGEDRDLSLKKRAEKATEAAKHRFFQQRRLIQEEENQKSVMARQAEERAALIKKETIEAMARLGFKPEWLRDTAVLNFSHHRKELVDEVTFAVRQDLQWRDIYPIVAAAVLGEPGES
ncbi:MAG: hypothetical protein WCX22_08435 [Methanoregula sp.]